MNIISSVDGNVRGAKVLLGQSKNVIDRPVNRLYPLETKFPFVNVPTDNDVQSCPTDPTSNRPKRQAAELANIKIKHSEGIN